MLTQSIMTHFANDEVKNKLTMKAFVEFIFKDKEVKTFLKNFKLSFKNKSLFVQALSHPSFCHEYQSLELPSFEKLEFLGDVVLNFLMTDKIYKKYPSYSEGDLSKFKSAIIAKKPLSRLSLLIGLNHLILLGKGEEKSRNSMNRMGDVFESILGAIYLDGGMKKCVKFLDRVLLKYDEDQEFSYLSRPSFEDFDYKSKLQELTMREFKSLPSYRAKKLESGEYEVTLSVENKEFSKVSDISKKEAQKKAAKMAHQKLKESLC